MRKAGFSIIELVIAVSLASFVLVGVASIAAQMARSQVDGIRSGTVTGWSVASYMVGDFFSSSGQIFLPVTNPNVGGTPASTTAAAISASAESLAGVGDGFPDLVNTTSTLSASFLMPISPKWSVRLSAYHEVGRIRDWHYQGLEQNLLLANGATYVINLLDAGPRDYRTTAVGIFFQFKI